MRNTPEEAKGKWCHTAVARSAAPRCQASDCMAWRWSRAKETKSYLDAVRAYMAANKVDFSKATQKVYEEAGSKFDEIEGYCGLAGKPE